MKIIPKKSKRIKIKSWLTGLALFKFCVLSLFFLGDSLNEILNHFQQMFGTVSWLFAILMVVLLAEILQLILFRTCNSRNLELIEAAAPPIGLLGTVFALMNGFTNLNLVGMQLEDAITVIVLAIAVSLKTTAAGIISSLIAMVVRQRLVPVLQRKEVKIATPKERKKNDAIQVDRSVALDNPDFVSIAELR